MRVPVSDKGGHPLAATTLHHKEKQGLNAPPQKGWSNVQTKTQTMKQSKEGLTPLLRLPAPLLDYKLTADME